MAFASRFGEPEIHPFIPKLDDGHPEIVVLHADDGYMADVWHTDVTFDASPPHVLGAPGAHHPRGRWRHHVVEPVPGLRTAGRADAAMLDGLTAIHSAANYGHPERQAEHPVVRVPPRDRAAVPVREPPVHPAHPAAGSRDESEALLAFLFDWSSQPHFTCRYSWTPGTIGIWDNRCTQHLAVNDFEGPRTISRVTILGDAARSGVRRTSLGGPPAAPHLGGRIGPGPRLTRPG